MATYPLPISLVVLRQGVQLVGMKQGDLEGCRRVIEEVVERKAEANLVGGVRRVRVDKPKLRTGGVGGCPTTGFMILKGV